MITKRIEPPEVIINDIAQDPNGLVSRSSFVGEDVLEIIPGQVSDLTIGIDHSVIPIGEYITEGIKINPYAY
jgi:hypothetical protein